MNYERLKEILSSREVAELVGGDTIRTPFELIEEILDKLPQEIWSNPNIKILDPACGRGAFLVAAKARFLAAGLDEKHVVENMLYGVDIDQRDVDVANLVVNRENMYSTNIICDDSLTRDWSAMPKFDVVIGNPPYQTNNEELRSKKRTGTKPLWFSFVEQASSLTKEEGYIAFVTPTTWMQHYSNIHKYIANKKMIACKGFVRSPFGYSVGTTVSYWVVKNKPSDTRCVVMDTDEGTSSYVNFDSIIPAKFENFTIKNEILSKTVNSNHNRFNFIAPMSYHATSHKEKLRETKTPEFKYPVYVTTSRVMWTNIQHELHSQWKVIVPKQGTVSKAFVNYDMVTSERGVCYLVNNEQEGIVLLSYLNSKLVRFMIESIRHNVNIATAFWRLLPAVDLSRSWTDEELYEHFNLTEEEIELIENTIS